MMMMGYSYKYSTLYAESFLHSHTHTYLYVHLYLYSIVCSIPGRCFHLSPLHVQLTKREIYTTDQRHQQQPAALATILKMNGSSLK